MAFKATAFVATVLCFSTLLSFAYGHDYLFVEGKVYCDPCRVQFETRISENLEGALVKLACRNRETGEKTFLLDGVTDHEGKYRLPVTGDHEEEICEVTVVKSPHKDCTEVMDGLKRARILLTKNNGVVEPIRYANPLGFMRKEAVAGCEAVLQELGFLSLV